MAESVIAERRGLRAAPTDANELEQWCRGSIAADAFKGPIMKAAKGKANPKLVDETLRRLLVE